MDFTSVLETEVDRWKQATVDPPVETAQDINNGYCSEFVNGVKDTLTHTEHSVEDIYIRSYGYDTNTYVSHSHKWIEYNGTHYDAECTEGVSHPKELPLFERAGIDPTK